MDRWTRTSSWLAAVVTAVFLLLGGCGGGGGGDDGGAGRQDVKPVVTLSPSGGTFDTPVDVTATSSVPAAIFYTVDGTTPTTSSTVYDGPILVSQTSTVSAFAVDSDGGQSDVATQSYTITVVEPDTTPPVVTLKPAPDTYAGPQTVSLSADEQATIFYTVDGAQPTTLSTVYTAPIVINKTTTLRYVAIDAAGNSSGAREAVYVITSATGDPANPPPADTTPPTVFAVPGTGAYDFPIVVALQASEAGAIYYTVNGPAPTAASSRYTGPIPLGGPTTLKFLARDLAGNESAVVTATYAAAPMVVVSGVVRDRSNQAVSGVTVTADLEDANAPRAARVAPRLARAVAEPGSRLSRAALANAARALRASTTAKTATTDGNGMFFIPGVSAPTGKRLLLTYEKPGMATFQRAVPMAGGELQVLGNAVMARVDTTVAGTGSAGVSIGTGTTGGRIALSLPAGALQDVGLTAVSGAVQVEVTLGDPSQGADREIFPGDYAAADADPDVIDTQLESVVFAEITVRDAVRTGTEYTTLSQPATVTLRLPQKYQPGEPQYGTYLADDDQPGNADDELNSFDLPKNRVPWWSYNEDKGSWLREDADPDTPARDDAVVVDINGELYAQAKVLHFTWWNVDQPITSHAELRLRVVDENGDPLQGAQVSAEGVTYDGTSSPRFTGADGRATVRVKRSTATQIETVDVVVLYAGLEVRVVGQTTPPPGDGTTAEGVPYRDLGDVTVDLDALNARVTGTVYNADGTPAVAATVATNQGVAGVTGTDGTYELVVQPGSVCVSAPGAYARYSADTSRCTWLNVGGTWSLNFARPGAVAGTVRNNDGSGAAGARVLADFEGAVATTDGAGRYLLAVPVEVQVCLEVPGAKVDGTGEAAACLSVPLGAGTASADFRFPEGLDLALALLEDGDLEGAHWVLYNLAQGGQLDDPGRITYALTTVLSVATEAQDPASPFYVLLDALGQVVTTDIAGKLQVLDLGFDPTTLPDHRPSAEALLARVAQARSILDGITGPVAYVFQHSSGVAVEVDDADVLALRAALDLAEVFLEYTLAYQVTQTVDEPVLSAFNLMDVVLAADSAVHLGRAKAALLRAIAGLRATVAAMRAEGDPQDDDLLGLTPEVDRFWPFIDEGLADVETSLGSAGYQQIRTFQIGDDTRVGTAQDPTSGETTATWATPVYRGYLSADLSALFDQPFDGMRVREDFAQGLSHAEFVYAGVDPITGAAEYGTSFEFYRGSYFAEMIEAVLEDVTFAAETGSGKLRPSVYLLTSPDGTRAVDPDTGEPAGLSDLAERGGVMQSTVTWSAVVADALPAAGVELGDVGVVSTVTTADALVVHIARAGIGGLANPYVTLEFGALDYSNGAEPDTVLRAWARLGSGGISDDVWRTLPLAPTLTAGSGYLEISIPLCALDYTVRGRQAFLANLSVWGDGVGETSWAADDEMVIWGQFWGYTFDAGPVPQGGYCGGVDSDADGLSDALESWLRGQWGILPDSSMADSDGDGLLDGAEYWLHGTNPTRADSDYDGTNDAEEVDAGTDPLAWQSNPQNPGGLAIGYRNLQYRNYEDPNDSDIPTSPYRSWLTVKMDGNMVPEADIASVEVVSPAIAVAGTSYWTGTYFGYSTATRSVSGPWSESGYTVYFGEPLQAGQAYTFRVTNTAGAVAETTVTYPENLILPYVAGASLGHEWLPNGDLRLFWSNPTAAPDWDRVGQLTVHVTGDGEDALYASVVRDGGGVWPSEVRISSAALDRVAGLRAFDEVKWRVQTRTVDGAGNNLARGYSTWSTVPWGSHDLRPADRYLQYRSGPDAASTGYRGWLGFARPGGGVQASDITRLTLLDDLGTQLGGGDVTDPAASVGFFGTTYYWLGCETGDCYRSGPSSYAGYLLSNLPALSPGTYNFEATTATGAVLLAPITIGLPVTLPVPTGLTAEWWSDGSLYLYWDELTGDPAWGEVDQLRVWVRDQEDADLLGARTALDARSLRVQSWDVDAFLDLRAVTALTWVVQTRAYAIDGLEVARGQSAYGAIDLTRTPAGLDRDGDGLTNEQEVLWYGTDVLVADSDDDGLLDGDEVFTHATNPLVKDSDGDGYEDGVEVAGGSDPTDPGSVPSAGTVFADANLEACVADATGGALDPVTLAALAELGCDSRGITSLAGIEGLTGLSYLSLWDNAISNLTPLAGLTGLTMLDLDSNAISDLTPLAGLTGLSYLYLMDNAISDLTPLAGLTGLSVLYLWDNAISDLTPLAGLTGLTMLDLDSNAISDLTPLAGLTGLSYLYLMDNAISDLTPLAGLTGLDTLDVSGNCVADTGTVAGVTNLTWDAQGTCGGSGTVFADAALESCVADATGGSLDPVTLAALTELGCDSRGITSLAGIEGLTGLSSLSLWDNAISDLTPLAGLTGLTMLDLDSNAISDLTPLAGLTGLSSLSLWDNAISDLTPLAGLTGLTMLDLDS
ncbi:MAG: chitobiase/beta-hexosaminidase C-terminal domain-containing protein, partial [Deferrisomatales bacterium]|nr:chitobiase/beta-hexosaminidase C-terminal domain-containing protein [Deferrisomatales bacterium]